MHATMQEEGYSFVRWDSPGAAVFRNADGKLELFGANKGHASWGFSWRGTDWEFMAGVTEVMGTMIAG